MENKNIMAWALYRGLLHYLGKWKHRTLKNEFLRWQYYNGWPGKCSWCGYFVQYKQRTLDHIIPVSVCLRLEMPGLIFDRRNFQMLCRPCNERKANSVKHLPDSVVQTLFRNRGVTGVEKKLVR